MNKYKEYEAIAVIGGRRLNVGTAEVYIDTEKHKPSKLLPKYICIEIKGPNSLVNGHRYALEIDGTTFNAEFEGLNKDGLGKFTNLRME